MLPFFVGRVILGIKQKFTNMVDDMIMSNSFFTRLVVFIVGFFFAVILTAILAPIAMIIIWVMMRFVFWILSFVVDLNASMF